MFSGANAISRHLFPDKLYVARIAELRLLATAVCSVPKPVA
jgi:hypothetical protein